MVKLSRIVKKIVESRTQMSSGLEPLRTEESYASRGKSQPTIDFTNLPSLDKIKFERETVVNGDVRKSQKNMLKVTKSKDFKNKNSKNKHENYKLKVRDRAPNKDRELHEPEQDEDPKAFQSGKNRSRLRTGDQVSKKKERLKVIKTEEMLSRGKRKRQMKKDAWRRKFEFEKEAKKMIEQFQKEDKHGKALTNLSGFKSQLGLIEESMRAREQLREKIVKNKSRHIRKAIVRNRNLFKLVTNNL